jgi:DNA-binding response OmpR family regulator
VHLTEIIHRFLPADRDVTDQAEHHDDDLMVAGVALDAAHRRALVDGYVVHLPEGEAALLQLLMKRAGCGVHRCELERAAHVEDDEAALERCIRRLNRRLQPSPLSPRRIQAAEGFGYRFVA